MLTARGERFNDMISKLSKVYMATVDKKFVRYIQHQKDKYDDGENIETYKLMLLALKKY